MVLTLLSSAILYAPGAFFFFPWKPVMQALGGDSYEVGYKHFRRDHSDPTNLCLHIVALAWQLLGNFGLLSTLDAQHVGDTIRGLSPALGHMGRPLSTVTAVLWVLTLVTSPAPPVCTATSAACIAVAYFVAPLLSPRELEMGMMGAFVATLVLASVVFVPRVKTKEPRSLVKDLAHAFKIFGLAAAFRLAATPWAGAWAASHATADTALVVIMAVLAMLPKPTVPTVLGGMLCARALGELSSNNALLFYGQAFVAQLSQGVAHDVSRQKATLLTHEDSSEGRGVKLAFEWSHVTYFPNLLMHSCYASLRK